MRLKSLFDAAVDAQPEEREALIASAGLDPAALEELHSLLAHHDQATRERGFLAQPAVPPRPTPASRVGQRLGAWEIVRPIGAGGMGEVFEARRADGQYDGLAAVKLLKRGMDSSAVLQRFAQERQALARLSHPHIARLLDAGASDDGLPYFVMEHVNGQHIDVAVQGRSLEDRLQLFLQLADAVAHAHRNLLVHRDLKPGNVLVDTEGQVKLLDFGIAKALDPLDTQDGQPTLGGPRPYTPNYASPEQVRGEPVTTATDVYSLGVLLYQMLTGTRPTGRNATSPAEAARRVLEDAPTRPSRLSPTEALDPNWLHHRKRLEGDLDNILLKALEKAPERRYASVDALRQDVQAYLSGHAVSARAAGATYLVGKFVRRHRLPVALAGAALVSLLAGLAGTAWQWQRAEAARAAEAERSAQVRAQAHRLLFDYHDAILLLPGSTPLVARLLADARSYLASLSAAAAAGGDTPGQAPLLRELGVAQRRLGDLYTTPGRPALGDVKAGLALHTEAVAVLQRALALQPADTETRYQLALAQAAWAGALQGQGRLQAAQAPSAAAASAFDTLASAEPGRVEYRVEQVRAQLHLADLYGGVSRGSLAQPALADSHLQRAVQLLQVLRQDFPQDLDVAALYATTQNARYLAAARDGRWADGLALLDALRPVFAQLVSRAPDNTLHARDAAVNSLSRGIALGQLGRHAEAREASLDGLARMQAVAAADPANRTARRDVSKLQLDVATASLKLNDVAEARGQLAAAVTTLEALHQADPADRRVAGLLALALATQAEAWAVPPAGPAQRATVTRAADQALAVATAFAAAAPDDPSGPRAVALVHQQLAAAWQHLDRPTQACADWRAAQAAWEDLDHTQRLRQGDRPRLEQARQGAGACSR